MELEIVYITRKIPLKFYKGNTYIYKIEDIKEGYVDEDVFIDSNGKEYMSIKDPFFNFSEEELGYYISPTIGKIRLSEDNLDEFEEQSLSMLDYSDNLVLIGYYNPENEEFSINELDAERLKEDRYQIIFDEEHNNEFFYIPARDFIDLIRSNDMELINEFCNDLEKMQIELQKEDELQIDVELEEDINEYLNEEKEEDEEDELTPREKVLNLKRTLDDRIIGQDLAKATICYAVYKNLTLNDNEKRTHILLVGPTGSGKSEIINTIKDVLNVPIVHVDSNSNSATGYVGDSITNNLASLYFEAEGNLDKAEHGILAFDEIDKKGSERESDVGGRGALNQILRMCDGQKYRVPLGKDGLSREIIFDTSNLTILACGAFPAVYDTLEKRNKKSSLGFKTSEEQKNNKIEITPEDIATIGNMGREFVGRFVLAPLNKLGLDELKQIMTESKISALNKQIEIFESEGIDFTYDDKFLNKIAKDALKENTGGRGIKNTIDKLFVNIVNDIILSDDFEENLSLFGTEENDEIIIRKTNELQKENTSKVKKLI